MAKKAKAKKAPAKKTVAKKTTAKKMAPVKTKITADKKLTKSALLQTLSTQTELSRKEVLNVLAALEDVIAAQVGKGYAFVLPGLFKIVTIKKPATKEKKNVPNPFKPGETMTVKAKPARTAIKIRPMKKLKAMA